MSFQWPPKGMAWFGSPKMPPQPPPPPPIVFPELPEFEMPSFEMPEMTFPKPFDPEAADTRRRRAEEIKAIKLIESKRKGYASTLLTGGRGVEDDPVVRRQSLLGS